MADVSMMLLTVLAAGAVVVGTGFVAVRADSSKQGYMTKTDGNTFMILALCSSANLTNFEKVVHSELDDSPRDDFPGYNVVVRDCQTDNPEGAWRRFRSYLQEARVADNRDRRVGVVLDAYGLLAMLASFAEPGAEQYLPDFVVAMSPVDFETKELKGAYETMSCERPGEPKDTKTIEDLEKMRVALSSLSDDKKAQITKMAASVEKTVMASIESPFEAPEYMEGATLEATPTRGFLTFSKDDVCASWMKGGYTAEELAQARSERERLEKEARPAEPGFAEEVAMDAKKAKAAVFRGEVRGRLYCRGVLKKTVDDLLQKIGTGVNKFQTWAAEKEEKVNEKVRGVFEAADRRMIAERV